MHNAIDCTPIEQSEEGWKRRFLWVESENKILKERLAKALLESEQRTALSVDCDRRVRDFIERQSGYDSPSIAVPGSLILEHDVIPRSIEIFGDYEDTVFVVQSIHYVAMTQVATVRE